MPTQKHLREFRSHAADLGLEEARIVRGGEHPALVGIGPDGRKVRFTVPSSPSDSARGERNALAALRRHLRPRAPAARKAVGARGRRHRRRYQPASLPPTPALPEAAVPAKAGFAEALAPVFDQLPLKEQFALLMGATGEGTHR